MRPQASAHQPPPMSSYKRPASAASAATTSVVEFGGYLDRIFDDNIRDSNAAYAAHIKASNELHRAEIAMMRSKRAVRALNAELNKATADAVSATGGPEAQGGR